MASHPNYEIFEELGRGENSVVYRAWDLLLSRDVAIKQLKSEPGSDGGKSDAIRIKEFLKEASFLAQFEHENILRIHTVDQDRGWIVMELMKGSLANQISNQPMPADTVRSVLRQVLGALEFLHSKEKVHGSVRPSNILINDSGTVKLSDFEASSRDGELRVPTASKKYLAPELIRSEFGEFGPTVDFYGLGFTALELLTGGKFDSLFPGTGEGAIDADVAWLRWHSSDEPMRPVKEIAPNVPNDLALVIDQLLKKPVDERPKSAGDVLKLLDDAPLVPVEVVEPTVKPIKHQDPAAILPSNAVKLREPKKKAIRKKQVEKPVPIATGKDKLNEVLGKPYVLWPICIGMLVGAVFIGLYMMNDRTQEPIPIVEVDPVQDKPKVEVTPEKNEPKIELHVVNLDVFPNANHAELTVAGQRRAFENLVLEAGEYEFKVTKPGFEPYIASLEITKDKAAYEIRLKEVMPEKVVDTELDTNILDENVQINPDVEMDKEPIRNPEEIAKESPSLKLPGSLLPKPGTTLDDATGLPLRAMVSALQDSSPMEMALVNAGTYSFGVPNGDLRTWELKGSSVEIQQPFYIGIDEVTGLQYSSYVEAEPQADVAAAEKTNFAVTNISARQAAEFCQWAGGRLPTEEEWEAAIRGPEDSGFPLPWSNDSQRRNLDADKCKLFRGESEENNRLVEAGTLTAGANELGLLNAIGNAAEWCDKQHNAEQFIVKGCSYKIPPGDHVRVTWRNVAKWSGAEDIGLRLLVPVVLEPFKSAALTFVAPSNLDSLLVSTINNQDDSDQQQVYTKTVKEIAKEFTAPAELVIDSGGFMDRIQDIQFSPDGQRIAVAGGKVVRIWDVESGDLLETLRGDMSRTSYGNVNAVAWSPDGKFLAVGISDYREHGNIRIYATENFDEISEVLAGHTAPTRKLSFSRDGNLLASVDADGMVLVRDWATRKILNRIPARDRDQPIYDLMTFPTDGPFLLGIDFQGPVVYSALTGKPLGSQDNMPSQVRGWLVDVFNQLVKLPYNIKAQPRVMDFRMEEGRWAGAGDAVDNGRSRFWIRVWESRDPVSSAVPAKELAAYDKHRWNVSALSLQPGGSLVASGDKFGEVHVWDSVTGKLKFKFTGQGRPIYEVAFDKGSSRLAFGTRPYLPKDWKRNNHGAATRVLDLRQRAITDVANLDDLELQYEKPNLSGHNVQVRKKDAYYLVERLFGNQTLANYRISAGRNPTTFTLLDQPKLGVEQPVVFGDNEGLLALWDSASNELKRAFIGHGNYVSAISSSGHGKLIATSSTDRTIRLWSLEDYVPTGIFDFKFENSAVREVVPGTSSQTAGVQIGDKIVSIDGKSLTEMFELMLLGKFDYKPGQTVPVTMKRGEKNFSYEMEMANGYDFAEPILNFYMGDNGQWIIWHPQGYYDASPGADRLIGWHLNRGYDKAAKFFEVQQFKEKLYRPDVIDGILETGSLEAAMVKVRGTNEDKQEVDFREPEVIAEYHPPSVKITWPTDRWQTDSETVTVKGEANSVNGLPLKALTLLHNGYVAKVFRPTRVNQLSMEIEFEVKLEPGANDLVLIAANAKSSSQGKHIIVDWNQRREMQRRDAIVLAIGISEFGESLDSLPYASNDAAAFGDAVKSQENGKLYGNVKTKLLTGEVADDDVLEGFQWLADNTKQGDVAMVYIASHAIVDRRDKFFIGTSNSDESKARSTSVSWRDLLDTLQLDLPDAKRMVFLDLKPTQKSIRPGMRNPLLDLAAPEMGTTFLSSNTLQQTPIPLASSENGAFLQAVLDTVNDQKFDTNPSGDELLNPMELAAGVTTRVKVLTNDAQQAVFFTPEFARFVNVLESRN